MKYILTATLPEHDETYVFDADDRDQAVFQAVHVVMTKAYEERKSAWALGEVTLTDETGEQVMAPMPSKIAEES
jgi:hypothetical protein